MKRSEKMHAERKNQNLTVTGSKGRNPWNDIDEPDSEFSESEDQMPNENNLSERKGSTRLLTTIQIITCAAVLAAAVALRLNGGTVYQNARNWYFESLNNSIVANSQADNIKHAVIDLWSTISSSRPENSQTPNNASSQPASSPVRENGAESGVSSQNNASSSIPSGAPSQNNASAPISSGVSSQNNAASAPSGGENASSPPVSP